MLNWQTEDDPDWQDEPERPSQPPRPQRRRTLIFTMLVVGLLLGGTAVVVARQLNQRVDDVNDLLIADIGASHATIEQAARSADTDLFVTLLSGRSVPWAEAQAQLVTHGRYQTPTDFGLTRLDDSVEPVIDLAPDLLSAVVTTTRPYAIQVGNGLTDTVRLVETAVYRPGPNRWLLSPPDSDFWGPDQQASTRYLTLSYPERDAVHAQRMLLDLDTRLAGLCANEPDLTCPPDLHLYVTLSTDPASLENGSTAAVLTRATADLILPTPTLIGLPVDAAAARALTRGYAAPVVTAALQQALGYSCCTRGQMFQAVADYYLAEQQLRPWPVTAATFDNSIATNMTVATMRAYWPEDNVADFQAIWPVYAVMDFVLGRDARPSTLYLLQEVAAAASWEGWLTTAMGGAYSPIGRIEQDWLLYLYENDTSDDPPPLTLTP